MSNWRIKIVPVTEPNHDGTWIWYRGKGTPQFDETVMVGGKKFFIVQKQWYDTAPSDQPFYMHSYLRG